MTGRGVALVLVCGLAGACLSAPPGADGDAGVPDLDEVQQRSWVQALAESEPGPRSRARLAYHSGRHLTFMFGGATSVDDSEGRPSMWSYGGGGAWTLQCDSCPPGPRTGFGLVYDSARDRLVLFGGLDGAGGITNDLWEWDGVAWSLIDPGATEPPSPRHGFWMVYDAARERTVIVAGRQDDAQILDDVHEWDGTRWTHPSSTSLPRRWDNASAGTYDVVNQRVLIYGGYDSASGVTDDLWSWDGDDWTQLCDDCTGQPRRAAALGYDPSTRRLLVVNGFEDGGAHEIDGTVELDDAGNRRCSLAGPPRRDGGAMVFDVTRDLFVYYGGSGPAACPEAYCQETLELERVQTDEACE